MSTGSDNGHPLIRSAFGAASTAEEVAAGIDLTGHTAIVTGGASGLGAETVRVLTEVGAHVTIADVDIEAARQTAAAFNRKLGSEHVSAEYLNLGDLAQVRDFAARWGDKPLNLLLNNAGIMACPLGYTKDGFERQFGINYLGHFLLTMLLTPMLERGAPSRVVSLSSAGHMHSDIHLDDVNYRNRPYHPLEAYGQSKTAVVLFAGEYDRRHHGRGIRAYAVQPGIIAETNLGKHITPEQFDRLGLKRPDKEPQPSIEAGGQYKTVAQGVATSIWAATAPELQDVGGIYLEDCAEAPPAGPGLPPFHGVKAYARDPEAARRLWDFSVKSAGLA